MFIQRRKLLSQNFLRKRKLVQHLVCSSSIGQNDLVLEIGPGKGIITEQLVKQAKHVLTVEIDPQLHDHLKTKFQGVANLTLYQKDFLQFELPNKPYKGFANLPFSIAGKIIRKLINAANPPDNCYLIVMKELGYRLSGKDKNTMFTMMHRPWFNFSIPHHFKRTDFTPMPSANAVMLRFNKRQKPLLDWNDRSEFQKFIRGGFHNGIPVVQNLSKHYGKKAATEAADKIRINENAKPSHLNLEQWITLYKSLI